MAVLQTTTLEILFMMRILLPDKRTQKKKNPKDLCFRDSAYVIYSMKCEQIWGKESERGKI